MIESQSSTGSDGSGGPPCSIEIEEEGGKKETDKTLFIGLAIRSPKGNIASHVSYLIVFNLARIVNGTSGYLLCLAISIQILRKERCSSKVGTLRKSLLELHKNVGGVMLAELCVVAIVTQIKVDTVSDSSG